jgi:hypothetical protein
MPKPPIPKPPIPSLSHAKAGETAIIVITALKSSFFTLLSQGSSQRPNGRADPVLFSELHGM